MENHSNIKSTSTTFILVTLMIIYSSAVAGDTNSRFIRTSCSATTYPTLCYSSLSIHAAAINQDPKLLAHTALSVSLNMTRSTSAEMVRLSRRAGLSAREAGAMRDCVEELSDSVEQITKSMAEMSRVKKSNFEMTMSDVETWVSAALTDEDTCMDGFAGKLVNGPTKTKVRAGILNVAHITSNALALVNRYAAAHHM